MDVTTADPSDRTGKLRRTLVSWHLLSTSLLVLALLCSYVNSTNIDQDVGSLNDIQSGTDLPVINTPENSTGNATEETGAPRAAECTVDVEKVCNSKATECKFLGGECVICSFDESCVYGTKQKTRCTPKQNVTCSGDQEFEREYECRYCYQLPHWQTTCNQSTDCALNKPRSYYLAKPFFVSTCWARSDHLCMGRRCFHKQLPCNWSQGYKWSTALLLSIFLGGFGVDRFYLGLWREGIGKLLSFGGLGVWTLVDVILIAVGYIGPWDGSLYI